MGKWRKVKNKYCQACKIEEAKEVHHIKARYDGGDNDENNLIDLCSLCHKYAPRERGDMDIYLQEGGFRGSIIHNSVAHTLMILTEMKLIDLSKTLSGKKRAGRYLFSTMFKISDKVKTRYRVAYQKNKSYQKL